MLTRGQCHQSGATMRWKALFDVRLLQYRNDPCRVDKAKIAEKPEPRVLIECSSARANNARPSDLRIGLDHIRFADVIVPVVRLISVARSGTMSTPPQHDNRNDYQANNYD